MRCEDQERKLYCETFDCVHIPQGIDPQSVRQESRKGMNMNWIQKHAAVLSAAAILATSTGAAYAADLGGVRTTVTLWLNGQQTEVQIERLDDDTWKITEGGEDAKEYSVTAGGAYTMKDGDAGYELDGQSVVDALSEGAASSYQNYM